MEGVIPETLVRVQTGGHAGLTLLKVPSPVSLLWVLTTSWFCSPGSDGAQGSGVPLTVLKGETLGRLEVRPWGI